MTFLLIYFKGADKLRQKFFDKLPQALLPDQQVNLDWNYTNANTFVAKVKNAFASLSLAPAVA